MKIGKAKFGANKKFFKIEDGDNVYRILPPLGALADRGEWSKYYRIEWGYKNTEGRTKIFQDCRVVNRESGMVEVESAAHVRRMELKKQLEDATAAFKEGKISQDEVMKIRNLTRRFNLEAKHHVNAVNLRGEIGLLKIGHNAKKALDAQIKRLREQGVDAIGVENGVYFNIYRSGVGRDTVYQVTPYTEQVEAEVNGEIRMIEQRKTHTMDAAFQARLDSEAFELDNLYPMPTPEEVERIVKEGPEAVDSMIARYKGQSNPAPTSQSSQPVQAASTESTVTKSVEQAEAEPVKEAKAEPVKQEQSKSSTAESSEASSTDAADLSDEEFLKSIGAL